mmetsp:Transcript_86479/g.181083  ORF Transcript_86479/g.181083 Transcript_86479/m.181083 type:complete len:100 (+) Transcript_86479:63-362(+)
MMGRTSRQNFLQQQPDRHCLLLHKSNHSREGDKRRQVTSIQAVAFHFEITVGQAGWPKKNIATVFATTRRLLAILARWQQECVCTRKSNKTNLDGYDGP